MKLLPFPIVLLGLGFLFLARPCEGQLRRPGFVTVKKDRNEPRLFPEKGAVYLEGVVDGEIKVKVEKTVAAYSNLKGARWLGNVFGNQTVTLLAISDRAYRIKGRAQQGTIAGWVSKKAISGVSGDFEEKLTAFHYRYTLVKQLIDDQQVALGMTVSEVVASIGPPDSRSSQLDESGRKETFVYISYERVPRPVTGYNSLGHLITKTKLVETESGRVSIEFTEGLVTSISETEGLGFNKGVPATDLPPYVDLL